MIARALRGTAAALAALAGILLVALTLLLCVDVAVRYLRLPGVAWIGDVSTVLLSLLTFLAAPWALSRGSHIAVDTVVSQLPPGARRGAAVVARVLGAAMAAMIAITLVRALLAAREAGTMILRTVEYPLWWLYPVPALAFAMMAAIFLLPRPAEN